MSRHPSQGPQAPKSSPQPSTAGLASVMAETLDAAGEVHTAMLLRDCARELSELYSAIYEWVAIDCDYRQARAVRDVGTMAGLAREQRDAAAKLVELAERHRRSW